MQFDWVSSVIGFLVGTAVGACGKYYADKFTDQRREKEELSQRKKAFLSMKGQMPELIAEIKTDLAGDKLIREFFVLPKRNSHFNSSKSRFEYYEEEHKKLRCKIDLLENQGFLEDVTTGNVPIYKMTEEFVDLINKYG